MGLLTDCTVGAVVPMTSVLLPARESLLARAGSVGSVVAAAVLIVAPLRARRLWLCS